jgi:hypothetical protein
MSYVLRMARAMAVTPKRFTKPTAKPSATAPIEMLPINPPARSVPTVPQQYVNHERLFEDIAQLHLTREAITRACDAADLASRRAGTPLRTGEARYRLEELCDEIRRIEMVNRSVQTEETIAASHSTKLSIQTPIAKTSDQLADEFLEGGALNLSTAFPARNPSTPQVPVLNDPSSLFECQPAGSPKKLVNETLLNQAIIGGHINDLITMSTSLPAPLDLRSIIAKAFTLMGATAAGQFAELIFASKASPWLKDIVRSQLGALFEDNKGSLSNYAHFIKAIDLVSGSKTAASSVIANKALLSESSATTTSAVFTQVVRGIADRLSDLYQPQFQVSGQPQTTRQELADGIDFRIPNIAALGAAAIYRCITEFNNWNLLPLAERIGEPPFPHWMFTVDKNALAEDFIWLMHKSGLKPLDTEKLPDASCSSLVDQAGCSVNFMQGLESGAMKAFALNPSVVRLSTFWKPALSKANYALSAVAGIISAMDQLEADRHRVDLADWQTFSRAMIKGTATAVGGFAGGSVGVVGGSIACGSTVVLVPFVPLCAAVGSVAVGLWSANRMNQAADLFNSRFLSETWTPEKFLPRKTPV